MGVGKMLGYFMDNLFNDKLYNQYYPLKTEEEKMLAMMQENNYMIFVTNMQKR